MSSTEAPGTGFRQTLRWQDGFVFSLTMPAALIATLGYSIGALGAWSAALLWGVSMLIATAANWVYSELAGMFPTKSGGISLYANEGWRRHLRLVGPVATFGYWFAWTGSLAVFGEINGSLIETRWFSGSGFSVDAGFITFGLADAIAAGALIVVFAANLFGIRPTVRLAYLTGAMLAIPLAVLLVGPFLGYLLSHIFTLVAFVLLRRDRPAADRPVRVHNAFVPIALVMALALSIVLVVGAGGFAITGYGGTREIVIACAILATSIVLYLVRRLVQDRERVRLRERQAPS